MGSPAILRNLGHFVDVRMGLEGATQINMGALSAGAGLIVTTTGVTIDTQRNPNATGTPASVALYRKPTSCVVAVPFSANVASGVSWAVGGVLKHSTASGGTYTTFATLNTVTLSKVGSTATMANALYRAITPVDLLGAKRFIRVTVTVTGSATTTGSLIRRGSVALVFDADQTPATATGARG